MTASSDLLKFLRSALLSFSWSEGVMMTTFTNKLTFWNFNVLVARFITKVVHKMKNLGHSTPDGVR